MFKDSRIWHLPSSCPGRLIIQLFSAHKRGEAIFVTSIHVIALVAVWILFHRWHVAERSHALAPVDSTTMAGSTNYSCELIVQL